MSDIFLPPSAAKMLVATAARKKDPELMALARQKLNAAHLAQCIQQHGSVLADEQRAQLVRLLQTGGA